MANRGRIRVIKRANRNSADPEFDSESQRDFKTDSVTIVTKWIDEFRQRRSAETRKAIRELLGGSTVRS
jgi:hypothetical protein